MVIPFSIADKQSESTFPKRGTRRNALMVAAVLLSIFTGWGMSEATGVTGFGRTVARQVSRDGTLAVEVNEPGIIVKIDGMDIVIAGTGDKGIRLKPGRYRFVAGKDGKLVRQELVTVTGASQPDARVRDEASPPFPPLCDESPDSSYHPSEESPSRRSS
jgi:hypothetical protein